VLDQISSCMLDQISAMKRGLGYLRGNVFTVETQIHQAHITAMADNSVNVTFPAPQPTQLTTVGDHVLATLAETGILKAGENVLRVTIGSRVWIGAIRHIPMSSDAPASSNTKSTQPTVVFGSLQTSNLAVAYAFLVECKTGKRMKLGVAEKYAWKSVFYREEGFTDVGHYTMGEPLANLVRFFRMVLWLMYGCLAG